MKPPILPTTPVLPLLLLLFAPACDSGRSPTEPRSIASPPESPASAAETPSADSYPLNGIWRGSVVLGEIEDVVGNDKTDCVTEGLRRHFGDSASVSLEFVWDDIVFRRTPASFGECSGGALAGGYWAGEWDLYCDFGTPFEVPCGDGRTVRIGFPTHMEDDLGIDIEGPAEGPIQFVWTEVLWKGSRYTGWDDGYWAKFHFELEREPAVP